MIQLESISIENFRGIRRQHLDFLRKNVAICGANGSGKSGVVDAIEFALTGDITRLSGAGSGDLSIRDHGPHVDFRTSPEKCVVELNAFAPTLGHSIVIKRSVDSPRSPRISPNDPRTLDLVSQIESHPEFALSRREIVKYIITSPGKRSEHVQTLLRLEEVEKVRRLLQKISNDAKREDKAAVEQESRSKTDLLQHLGVETLKKETLLAVVNQKRATVALPPIPNMAPGISLKEGLSEAHENLKKPRIIKSELVDCLLAASTALSTSDEDSFTISLEEARETLQAISDSPSLLKGLRQKRLVELGIDSIDDDACPLCDSAWDLTELRLHLAQKLSSAATAIEVFETLSAQIDPLIAYYRNGISSLESVTRLFTRKLCEIDTQSISDSIQHFRDELAVVSSEISEQDNALKLGAILKDKRWRPRTPAMETLQALEAWTQSLPEPSVAEQAKEFLILADERLNRVRAAHQTTLAAKEARRVAELVSRAYGKASTAVLEKMYEDVQADFSSYYRSINGNDEHLFEGSLVAGPAHLALDVDFYGRGKFPPGAYHSEGHQDGMGLCLYLALMKHTLGDDFRLAVLDDVLMSVDSGHRRSVCALLRREFPTTQFFLTTHDQVWLKFMKTENLVSQSVVFNSWSVDTGPNIWSKADVWDEIDASLKNGEVPTAAHKLRVYMEFIASQLADDLRAKVEFRGDGSYDLGDLLPSVLAAAKSAFSKAKAAAKSWGRADKELDALAEALDASIAAAKPEEWMINKAVHFNAWVNLQPAEFGAIAQAYRSLLEALRCEIPSCRAFYRVVPRKGAREAIRCDCGKVNFSLVSKN